MDEITIQRKYYAETAARYEEMHVHSDDAHFFALCWLSAIVDHTGARSVLDIGSGTGRAVGFLKNRHPALKILGIEPFSALRDRGYAAGIGHNELIDGDATDLGFATDSFDIVCSFGALHHIRENEKAISEISRVARTGVFLSDGNNFGQGSATSRVLKHSLRAFGLWPLARFLKTRGKGFHFSEGDGVYYSYSAFDSVPALRRKFTSVHYMNTSDASHDLLWSAPQLAIFARNKRMTL